MTGSSKYYNPFFTKKAVNSALLLTYRAMRGGKILQSPEDFGYFYVGNQREQQDTLGQITKQTHKLQRS